jgi:hypothetical protein
MAGIVDIIRGVTSGLAAPVVDYLKARQELRSQERRQKEEYREAVHQRKVELVKLGLTADMNWEMEFARQAENSWKDEYTLGVVSIPLWMCFIPGGATYVTAGFGALAGTPVWYQAMVQILFYATVGIRMWRRQQSDT